MPINEDSNFDFTDLRGFTADNLQNPEITNNLTDNILKNTEIEITQIYKSGETGKESWPNLNENLFDNIYIGNKPINELFDAIDSEGLINDEMVYKRKMLMISEAMLKGKPVKVMPYNHTEYEEFVNLNSRCPGAAHKPMTFLQKILAMLGIAKYKRMELVDNKYKAFENHLKAVGEDLNEQGKWHLSSSREKIRKNREFLDNFFPAHEKYLNKQKEHHSQLEQQYFSQIKSDKEIKGVSDLPPLLGSNARDWVSIATLAVMLKGFSLKDACDPDNADAAKARAEVGVMLNELGHRINDPIHGEAAKKELYSMLLEGSKKYLETPMPPQEELLNFKESELPEYYLQMVQIPGELFDPLEKVLPTISDDVSDLKVIHLLQEATFNPAFFNIIKCINNSFNKQKVYKMDESSREGDYTRLAAHEIMCGDANEKSVEASTISEYIRLNQPKGGEIDKFNYETALKNYLPDIIENPAKDVVDIRDIFFKKMNTDEMLKKSDYYAESKVTYEESIASKGKDIEHYNARLDLAKNLSDKIFQINNEQPTAQQKYQKVNDLFHNSIFLGSTGKSAQEVKEISSNEAAVSEIAAQVNIVLKEEDARLKEKNCNELAKTALQALFTNDKENYPAKDAEKKMIKKIIETNAFQTAISGKTGKEIEKIAVSQINEKLKNELANNSKADEKAFAERKAALQRQSVKNEKSHSLNK